MCGDMNLYKGPLDSREPIAEFKTEIEALNTENNEYFTHLVEGAGGQQKIVEMMADLFQRYEAVREREKANDKGGKK